MGFLNGEVKLNIPASKAWEIYRNNELTRKVNPDLLADAQYLEGDGTPGSIRLLKLGPAVNKYVSQSKEKIEKVKEDKNGTYEITYKVVDGELKKMYDPYTVTFTFTPLQAGDCTAAWRAQYNPLIADVPPPEKAKKAALQFMKEIENFYLSFSAAM
ncbi:hypothetical protein SUGI_0295390 [Cryptomeria japonica]|uniref:pathogenesis-related protein B n=1 Tax=Cryptomeria japonica TaxID=3369 RepID=UPI002408CDFB|nr:pathogenesis-related protein B [Cryptomeria japonica]GLJ17075.1 hypothetical protein SUGI_0295390 [Cryptomeria japonica]